MSESTELPERAGFVESTGKGERWTARRKAELIAALDAGQITETMLAERHGITPEELAHWRWLLHEHGLAGLRTTRIQVYRDGRKYRAKRM